jgi:hypothetical protein
MFKNIILKKDSILCTRVQSHKNTTPRGMLYVTGRDLRISHNVFKNSCRQSQKINNEIRDNFLPKISATPSRTAVLRPCVLSELTLSVRDAGKQLFACPHTSKTQCAHQDSNITCSVQVSHFWESGNSQKYGRTFSRPVVRQAVKITTVFWLKEFCSI